VAGPEEANGASRPAPTPARAPEDDASEDGARAGTSVVMVLLGPIAPADVPALCARLDGMLRHTGAGLATCDVGAVPDATVATVDALARLQLAAKRAGGRIRLRHASPQLRALLDLVGLADAIPCCSSASAST
jgi:ABC-type transporter Mla MlaB component